MNHSEQLNELFSALAKAQGEMPMAGLSANNPFFKSKYADLPSLVKASRPALAKYGLSVIQTDWVDNDGKCFLKTVLGHSSGQWIQSIMAVTPQKTDIQSVMSYRSYLRRYSYAAIVGVIASDEEDDDGNGAVERDDAPRQPYPSSKITKEQLEMLENALDDEKEIAKTVLDHFKLASLKDIPKEQFMKVSARISELVRLKYQK